MKKCSSKWPKLIFVRHFTSYYGNFFTVHAHQYCLMSQSRIWKYHALFFLKDLFSVVSTCRKTVEMCTSCIGSPFAIFQMIWKLTIPSLSSGWFAVYYTAVEGVSSFESKAGKWNQPRGVTIEMKASEQVGGGEVLPMMAYTGRLRPKGVLPFSGFRYMKGRDFTSWSI